MTEPASTFASPLPRWLAATLPAAWCSMLYSAATRLRNNRFDRHSCRSLRIDAPVISIGGIRAGGTGKTPTVMLVADLLQKIGCTVAVLSRGYRRKGHTALQVAPEEIVNWEDVGDEPAMIRNRIPGTWLGIGPDRFKNGQLLHGKIGDRAAFLLDDGFQHRRLHRDLDIVCIHETLFQDRPLPQGFLREPLSALSRAQLFFLICTEENTGRMMEVGKILSGRFPSIGQCLIMQETEGWINLHSGKKTMEIPCEHPLAVCGIARPDRFFDKIHSLGIRPCKEVAFPDHFRYAEYHFRSLRELYSQGLITTEKDAVRLRGLPSIPKERSWYLKIQLKFAENDSLHRFHHYIRSIDFPLLKGGLDS